MVTPGVDVETSVREPRVYSGPADSRQGRRRARQPVKDALFGQLPPPAPGYWSRIPLGNGIKQVPNSTRGGRVREPELFLHQCLSVFG